MERVPLAPPQRDGPVSLQAALVRRRSVRDFEDRPVPLDELGQILWAAQGVVDPAGRRTAPSAGATYPLELYAVTGRVIGLEPGVYRYLPEAHALLAVRPGDLRRELAACALEQQFIARTAFALVVAADFARTTARYGRRGIRYVWMEAGHVAQNICLQGAALGLGSVVVGAFDDEAVRRLLGAREDPLCVVALGHEAPGSP